MIHRIKTIDSHTAGEPLRLVIDGLPSPEGRTMLEKRAWAQKRLDHLRKSIMLEPRGHTDMYGALLTEPVTRDGHAGILFMHNEGWSTMCGHGIIAVSTIAIERGFGLMLDQRAAHGSQPINRLPGGRIEGNMQGNGQRGRLRDSVFSYRPDGHLQPSVERAELMILVWLRDAAKQPTKGSVQMRPLPLHGLDKLRALGYEGAHTSDLQIPTRTAAERPSVIDHAVVAGFLQ